MHPRSRHEHLLDYVLVRRQDRRDVLVTKAIPDADGWTDHLLVISNMRIRLQPRRRPQNNLPADDDDGNAFMEDRRCKLWDTVQSTALAVLGRARRQHRDSFDDNDAAISSLLAEKNRMHKAYVDCPTDDKKAASYRSRHRVQWRLCEMQDAWTSRKAKEIQRYADRNEQKNFFAAIKETIKAVQQLSSGKASESDATPSEIYKHGGPQPMNLLVTLFQEMWHQGEVLQDFKDATIVHLYKREGSRQLWDNRRGISLLNIARRIFARILNRLSKHLEQGLLPESRCSFRRHRWTTEMIFVACQLQEKCPEMRTHLYSTFVDLTKVFDTVNREGL
nr:unnamed protein product [Spirometra erinaceieuropaei]